MKPGTASLDEKKKRQTVKMKKLMRFVIPCKYGLGLLNTVAIMNPIMARTTSLERKSSGVRWMFLKLRRMSMMISEKNELANFGPRWLC